jgi:hypothetical protein
MKNRPVSSIQSLQSKRFLAIAHLTGIGGRVGRFGIAGRKAAERAADASTCGIEAVVVIWFAIYYDGLVILDCRHDPIL